MTFFPHAFNGVIVDSGLIKSEGEEYFIRVSRNLRPNAICINCETVSEGQRISFEWEGVIDKSWKLAFERISPYASDGPRNARLHRSDSSPDKIRTQIHLSDIDDRSEVMTGRGSFFLSVEVQGRKS